MHFVNLRKFHNKIKQDLYNRYAKNVNSLLEIASGKGGDINKACNCNIKYVVGYDINPDSVIEAKRRAKKKINCKTKFKYYTQDLSSHVIVNKYNKFDIVSAMFSFHYFFKTEDTFITIIKSITKNLKKGGYFIGTIFDYDKVNLTHFNKSTKHFYVKKKLKFSERKLFGNEIDVYIGNTVLNKPEIEYLVPFDKFVEIMKLYNFVLVESNLFNPVGLKGEEKQLSSLYRTFVFKLI